MTGASKKLHYWDSYVFLALLKNEPDKINECLAVLKAAKNRQVTIVTSALTFIEVVRLEKGQPKLPRESEEKIRAFFRHEWIAIAYSLNTIKGQQLNTLPNHVYICRLKESHRSPAKT